MNGARDTDRCPPPLPPDSETRVRCAVCTTFDLERLIMAAEYARVAFVEAAVLDPILARLFAYWQEAERELARAKEGHHGA